MKKEALRNALARTLQQLATEREDVAVFTSDATGSASLGSFARQFPSRLIEMGIAEQNEVSVAAGLSTCGFTSFVCAPAAFMSSRALEQVKVDVAYSNTNVKVIGISGGVSYGATGTTHHAIADLANTASFDNLTVLLPADSVQLEALVRQMADDHGPYYMRIGRNPVPAIYEPGQTFPIGRAHLLRKGSDIAILSAGEVLVHALAAAQELSRRGIEAQVLDLYCVKPIDRKAVVRAARETGRILVAEEHTVAGGIGSLVCQITAEECRVPVRCLGFPSDHVIAGTSDELFHYYGLDAAGIVHAAEELVKTEARLTAAVGQ